MINLWKQFVGWGTGLRASIPEIFSSARIRITLYYFTIGICVMVLAGFLIDLYITSSIQQILGHIQDAIGNKDGDPLAAQSVTAIIDSLRWNVWLVELWIIFAMALFANIIAALTLRPIRRALESQRRFVANASHELRTPLAVMQTNSEVTLLDEEHVTKQQLIGALRSNMEEIARMTDTLRTLLSFSGYERRATDMFFKAVNLYDVADRVLQIVKSRADRRGVKLTLGARSDSIVRGNPSALEEMMLNLVKNAIAFTPKGQAVHVNVMRESRRVVAVSVVDEGPGISPDDMPHIFEPFYRGANSNVRHNSGQSSGLGLAIVAEIVKMHRARISVKSESQAGTSFTVRLAASRT